MMLTAAAAGLYALGTVFVVVAYATLSVDTPHGISTFRNWAHAADWLHFCGAFGALAAVGVAGWEALPSRDRYQIAEVTAAAVATLLVALGAFVAAVSSPSQPAADVIAAVGIGLWALIALVRAASYNLAEQQSPGSATPLVPLWLIAAGALVLLAVGSGFHVGPTNRGRGIAAGILEALGVALLAQVLISARSKGMMQSRPVSLVITGLLVLAVGFIGGAIVSGLVFTPQGTVKGLRIGVSIVNTILFVGVVILGLAAWARVGELVALRPIGAGAGWLPAAGDPAAPVVPAPANRPTRGWAWRRRPGGPETSPLGAPVAGPTAPPPAAGSDPTVQTVAPDPTERETAADPTRQTESAEPTVQTESAKPTVQTESAEPTVQTESAEPTVQTESAEPTVQTESAEATVPGEAAEPAGPSGAAEPTAPAFPQPPFAPPPPPPGREHPGE
jgi:hypothetical protein